MSTTEQKYSFEEMFADWRKKNEGQCKKYIEEMAVKEEHKIESHSWYTKRVEPLPVFKYKLPGDINVSEFDWELLLKLLESSESYCLKIHFDDIKLVCRNGHYPSLTVNMYGLEKSIFLMNSKEVKDLFYDLIDENIKRITRTHGDLTELYDYDNISEFQKSYWQFMKEKVDAKLKVSEVISGNVGIMHYIKDS